MSDGVLAGLRFAGQSVMLEGCECCLHSQDWAEVCPACQPPPQVCAALGMPDAEELAAAAGRLCDILALGNPSKVQAVTLTT